ncbi:alpha-amylase family glycosyl hydrolase, partial [Lacticaseibacillus paracasei]|uniref:alpha-amylase family glycosyl hydrolase n=1 Tax=Lacticaseibacillus paracasei TaxID=1597 RepID=UPI001F00F6DC
MGFHNKVIYQLYPKSFYDSNGDGVGDLRGIIDKIDYLKSLHVDMIWFNPFFVSPQYDNGYDVADYRQIDPRFGTMADFDELAKKLKAAGIDIMLDMVLNGTIPCQVDTYKNENTIFLIRPNRGNIPPRFGH